MDDRELLQEYAECQSEKAFAELVGRHINLVYSAALRMVHEPALAEDVTQSVFVQLARKAATVRKGNALPGWLYRVTHCQAVNALRAERTRREHETEAVNMAESGNEPSAAWESIAPGLDEAMKTLSPGEQNAVVLRFFQGRSWQEVGSALDLSEDAAQKRVSRAVEKLRSHFVRRGIVASSTLIVSAIAANAVQAAPAGLASTVTATSLAGAAGAGLSGLFSTLTQILFMYKKTTCALAAVALIAAISVPLLAVKADQIILSDPAPFKYGLYLHFDISTFAGYRGAKDIGQVSPERYAPASLDIPGWARTAKEAGMDCAVLTVKHEAGFCLWDSDDYDYDVANSPVKTDVLAEFITACKAEGIIPGIHYSIPDAHNEGAVNFKGPVGAAYFDLIKKHTRELHTKYPDIRVHVFDVAGRLSQIQAQILRQTVKELNPSCAVLFGVGKDSTYASDSVVKGWFWSADAPIVPAQQLYGKYSQTRAKGWPFLLNVGPDSSGRIPDSYVAVLMQLKSMIEQNPTR